MKYQIAEKFKSLQGEGVYAGTPMAFIRFVGCSVGKKICQHCDTVFERTLPWQGGGEFTTDELLDWAQPYEHICLTGGEPLDQDLTPFYDRGPMLHIETSGTVKLPFELVELSADGKAWICISPKPGFIEANMSSADEIKVIVPGLGTSESLGLLSNTRPRGILQSDEAYKATQHPLGDRDTFRWPTHLDALRWAKAGGIVFLQPRNGTLEIDQHNLMIVRDLLAIYPQLRLSVQMHKILKVQ